MSGLKNRSVISINRDDDSFTNADRQSEGKITENPAKKEDKKKITKD